MRQPRYKPNQPETYYHVMTRTAQQTFLFDETHSPGFKDTCHKILSDMAQIYCVEIFAWVFMDNHIHICCAIQKPEVDKNDIKRRYEVLQSLISQPRRWYDFKLNKFYARFTDLSWFMWDVNRRIAIAYNKLHGTKGHVWGDRFKSKVIENEDHLLRVMAYIEQNPIRAGLCEKPSDYAFSSSGLAKRELARGNGAKIIIPEVGFLKQFHGSSRAEAYVSWVDFLSEWVNQGKSSRMQNPRPQPFGLSTRELDEWLEDFSTGKPSDWAEQGYGSPLFCKQVAKAVKERRLELAYLDYLSRRKSRAKQRAASSTSTRASLSALVE